MQTKCKLKNHFPTQDFLYQEVDTVETYEMVLNLKHISPNAKTASKETIQEEECSSRTI